MIIKYKFYTPKHELVEQDLTAFATIEGAENQKAKILEILDRDGKKVVQDILKIKKIDLDYRGLYFHPKLKIMALIRIPQNGTIDDYKNYIFRLDKDISEKVVQEIVDKATKNFVNKTELANYSLKTDLTDYAKKSELTDFAKKSEIPTLDNVALKSDLNDLAKKSEIPDVSNFVNKTELTEYAKNTELSKYALKTDVPTLDDYAKKTDLSNYALKSELANYALKSDIPSLVDYAKKSDIPALDDYAKKTDIPSLDDYVDKKEITEYAKKSDIASVYRVKGNADNLDNITEKQVGDVYNFTDGANYVWTGTEWDKLSETIDLSEYAKKSEIPGFKGETSDLKAVQDTSKKGDIYKLTSDNALYIFDGTNFLKFADFESEGNGVDI